MTERLPRFSVAHWGRYPRLTWQAWSLAVQDGHTSPRAALDAALAVQRKAAGTAHESTGRERTDRSRERQRNRSRRAPRKRSRTAPVAAEEVEREFMSELASGAVPSLRSIRARMHVGPDRAKALREHLESVTTRT